LPSSNSALTRRRFLTNAGVLGLASAVSRNGWGLSPTIATTDLRSTSSLGLIIKNRSPLAPNAFYALPAGSIHARGWLEKQIQIQSNGLSGHLDETWDDVGPNSGWLGGTGESWERGPYFLDGLVPLAYQANDPKLKAKAQRFIDWSLDHQTEDGMIGPTSNNDWWPRIVFLKALTQYQELSGDERVIPVMDKYLRHQLETLPKRPLRDWSKFRWQDELLTVIWLYNRTGSPYLIELAHLIQQQGYDWVGEFATFPYKERITAEFLKLDRGDGLKDLALATHGVNNGQGIKTGPVWYLVSGQASDFRAAFQMISELDRYHGLPNGMFSCDEHLAGLNPSQGSELCTVVEYMFSLEHALAITGNPFFGDRLEKLAFNALPGTFTDDMWAHQYTQEPNQVECSLHHKPWTTDGPESNLYGLEPNFGCCTANFHQGWPKFVNSLFFVAGDRDGDSNDGLVAAVYAPCEVSTHIRGTQVHIMEETDYPFKGKIRFTINPASEIRLPLQFRIPAWAAGTRLAVNGEPHLPVDPSSFAQVDRVWRPGDQVEIEFPRAPRISRWFNDSIAIERGPLVFSLGIGESWVKLRDRGMTADWQVFPASAWNYALDVDKADPAKSIDVDEAAVGEIPFSRRHSAVELRVKARRLNGWHSVDCVAEPAPPSPVVTDEPAETVKLIPYAAAKLRITAFPQLKPTDS
jgi:hypothetical protein